MSKPRWATNLRDGQQLGYAPIFPDFFESPEDDLLFLSGQRDEIVTFGVIERRDIDVVAVCRAPRIALQFGDDTFQAGASYKDQTVEVAGAS